MSKKILVSLGHYDRTEEVVPYVEKIAQPGIKVVFLLRYPVAGFIWPREERNSEGPSEQKRLADHYSWEENLLRAQKKVSPAFEVLQRKGAEVAVDLYTGSLRKAISNHAPEGDVHLIMARAGIRHWVKSFFDGTNSVFKLFKRPAVSSVLLIHPRALR
jgi:hypothetical protein